MGRILVTYCVVVVVMILRYILLCFIELMHTLEWYVTSDVCYFQVVKIKEKCHCKFVWCCYVKCKTCEKELYVHTCK